MKTDYKPSSTKAVITENLTKANTENQQSLILLTWINFNPSMDK